MSTSIAVYGTSKRGRKKQRGTKKKYAIRTARVQATNHGHVLSDFYKNGEDLRIARCKGCLSLVIVQKKNYGWIFWGTATEVACTRRF